MRRGGWIIGAIGLGAAAALLAYAFFFRPTVPSDAATTAVARAVGTDGSAPASTCLPRIEDAAGVMDVCWEAHRDTNETDPQKDYYQLRVWSTFGGDSGSGARWAMLKADLEGTPADRVFTAWPEGDFEGPCRQTEVHLLLLGDPTVADVCGHTTGRDVDSWGHSATWTCESWCLIPSHDDRALSLYVLVGVADGTIPTWDIFAELGG